MNTKTDLKLDASVEKQIERWYIVKGLLEKINNPPESKKPRTEVADQEQRTLRVEYEAEKRELEKHWPRSLKQRLGIVKAPSWEK
jgi:hypothetical protein